MQLDRRIPAVYVDVEDRSVTGTVSDVVRSAYNVIISDRGPHNRVVEVDSVSDFISMFGSPNIDKTGQSHYLCVKHLQMSQKLYVTRPVMDDATLSNVIIKYNDPNGSSQRLYGNYSFTHDSTTVNTDRDGLGFVHIDDYIYSIADNHNLANKIVNIDTTSNQIILDSAYTGTTTVDADAYLYYPGLIKIYDQSVTPPVEFSGFILTNNSNIIRYTTEFGESQITIGMWLKLPDSDNTYYQVIDMDIYNNQIILDKTYDGSTNTNATIQIYQPFSVFSIGSMNDSSEINPLDTDNIFTIYSIGPGEWYNNLRFIGYRNIEYEYRYIDTYGNPLYKYAFMNLALYEEQIDGSLKLLEGPWIVSLIRTTPQGEIVRDIVTGDELYIETVINKYSRQLKCVSALGAAKLAPSSTDPIETARAEQLRLQLLTIFQEGTVLKTNNVGLGGVKLNDGSSGSQYDSQGRLNLQDNTILRGKVAQAYNGTLTSVDGTIENITQSIYPWFIFDYVYCGGYDSIILDAARQLVDFRDDCLLLADTGGIRLSADEDINARMLSVPWNTYNAALYTQYRKIFDTFTGKEFYITPVYHAIERHLYTDDKYWYAEPVAGIEKGAISEPITLAYRPNLTKLGDLTDVELNPVIVEPDGIYILTQLTTWKRLSVLKRMHVVKFIHFLKHQIPVLLKDLLQRKATQYWKSQASLRLNNFLNKYIESSQIDRYVALESFSVDVQFNTAESEIVAIVQIKPIRAIEKITVHIIVT
jgi:hypothetical protein